MIDYDLSNLPIDQAELWICLQANSICSQIMAAQAEQLGFSFVLAPPPSLSLPRTMSRSSQRLTRDGRKDVYRQQEGDFKFMGIVQTPLIPVLLALVVVGVLLWLVNNFIPMASSIKSILNAVVIILVVVWLLNVFGLMHYVTNFHVNRAG